MTTTAFLVSIQCFRPRFVSRYGVDAMQVSEDGSARFVRLDDGHGLQPVGLLGGVRAVDLSPRWPAPMRLAPCGRSG
jgi:hypothetical protein